MILVIPLEAVEEPDRLSVGGKAYALSRLGASGMDVPGALCVTTEAYRRYVTLAGLQERIQLELNRKRFEDMRWEEMWDASLRIRNMFLRTPVPSALADPIRLEAEKRFGDRAVVVRSSAPDEDSSKASFAGLHESYVNIRGPEKILMHIRLVWASLWSDAALLYRKELGLLSEKSSMAVLVQEIVVGERSGVMFGMHPNHSGQAVIEAVYGLNAGLVDGTVEPDRWILDRSDGGLRDHLQPSRQTRLVPAEEGTRLEALPEVLSQRPPLNREEVGRLFTLANKAEILFGVPQDIEWTFREDALFVLQSRPVTTVRREASEDSRPWYLSLRRSLDNLKNLRSRIENQLVPQMLEESNLMAKQDLDALSDGELANEIERRKGRYEYWVDVYWKEFIPFAHGMRLFGQIYNDTVMPENPFEFMGLLETGNLVSTERNRLLKEMAGKLAQNPGMKEPAERGSASSNLEFERMLSTFIDKLGIPLPRGQGGDLAGIEKEKIIPFIFEMAETGVQAKPGAGADAEALTEKFLAEFGEGHREYAHQLLDLARASYRLRDDDNIYLGQIEKRMQHAFEVGKRRIGRPQDSGPAGSERARLVEILENMGREIQSSDPGSVGIKDPSVRARQMVGQPAGPGIARGRARVILQQSDLFKFKKGEILVCDAIDPNMTFVVPLSSGIVERRGGMLIHGAIIAREYGLPCVTGVADATKFIQTGQTVTLDGYLGIVIVG